MAFVRGGKLLEGYYAAEGVNFGRFTLVTRDRGNLTRARRLDAIGVGER